MQRPLISKAKKIIAFLSILIKKKNQSGKTRSHFVIFEKYFLSKLSQNEIWSNFSNVDFL